MKRMAFTIALVLSLGASAQSFPASDAPTAAPAAGPAPEGPPLTAPPLPPANTSRVPNQAPPTVASAPAAPLEPNLTSVLGARALGQWKRGQSFQAGFPLVSLRAYFGLTDAFDLGLGLDSFYGAMNELRIAARLNLVQGSMWSLGAHLEVGGALFGTRASREVNGARWITARRNYNIVPGLVLAYQGPSPRAARVFFAARYMLTLDNEPFSRNPLDGVPPLIQTGHNVIVQGGAEWPISARSAFTLAVGLEFHGRPEDSVMMPNVSLGLVTSL